MAYQFDYNYQSMVVGNDSGIAADYFTFMQQNFDAMQQAAPTAMVFNNHELIPIFLQHEPNSVQATTSNGFQTFLLPSGDNALNSINPNSTISDLFDYHQQIYEQPKLEPKAESHQFEIPDILPDSHLGPVRGQTLTSSGYKCQFCPKKFPSKDEKENHISECVKARAHECAICKKRFKNRAGLMQHQKTHTQDRSFQCHFCSRKFTQKSHLDQHERIHTGAKPFVCQICGKAFRQRAQQIGHESHLHGNKSIPLSATNVSEFKPFNLQ